MNIMPTPLLDQIKADIDSQTKLKEAVGLTTDIKNADYLILGGFVKGAAHENDADMLWPELVRSIMTIEEEPRKPEEAEIVLFLTAANMGNFTLQQGKQMGHENPLEEIQHAVKVEVKMLDMNKRFAETNGELKVTSIQVDGDEDIEGVLKSVLGIEDNDDAGEMNFTAEGDDNATRH